MSTAHAKLSASSSHRWLNCPGSVKAEEGIVERKSAFADEGSAAHELAEIVLSNGGSCFDWLDRPLIEYAHHIVTQEMADSVQVYVDYVKNIGGVQMYEERVGFDDWVPDGFGTADAIAVCDEVLHVIDLKMGKGVRVEAEENTQGLLYALGALSDLCVGMDVREIVIHIVQPRLDNISEWRLPVDDLLKRGEWIRQRAEIAASGEGERAPGEKQCQWCKAKPTCPALQAHTFEIIASDFDNLDMANPDTLSDAQLAKALGAKKLIVSWLDAVEQHAQDKLERGESFPGYKLVAGRSVRQWGDDVLAEKVLCDALGDDAYERKLLSVAKAEKVLGKKRQQLLEGLVIKPDGKPTIAPASDQRKAIGATAEDFENMDCGS